MSSKTYLVSATMDTDRKAVDSHHYDGGVNDALACMVALA